MTNTSIREQLEKRLIISLSRLFIGKPYPDLGEIVGTTMTTLSAEYTPTADVAELVRAAKMEEKRIIYLALAKLTLDSKDSYYLGRDLLNYMKKHGYELATAQPPHKAEQ